MRWPLLLLLELKLEKVEEEKEAELELDIVAVVFMVGIRLMVLSQGLVGMYVEMCIRNERS